MRHQYLILAVLVFPIATAVVPACTKPCTPELSVGAKYNVAVIEPYDSSGKYQYNAEFAVSCVTGVSLTGGTRCSGFDGLQSGTSLGLTVRSEGNAPACSYASAETTAAPQALTISSTANVGGNRGFMYSGAQVQAGSCAGTWELCFRKTNPDLSALTAPTVGQVPPVLMERVFTAAGGSDCPSCNDLFVVQLSQN